MKSFLKPVFVGRNDELTQLDHTLAAVQGGVGRCVLVTGEAGIGKSRLIAEIQSRTTASGFLTFTGRCFEQDCFFPYAPLIDMLRPFFAQSAISDRLDALGPPAPDLVKLLPELAPHLSAPQLAPPLEAEVEKRCLFEALTDLFLRQAEAGPLLIIVEDLHWGDEASLEFLLYLVRRIVTEPIFLLLSQRNADANAGLAELLTGLDREQIAAEIRLKPLTRTEVELMLGNLADLPRPLPTESLAAIHELTEGNPFFVEEIVASLSAMDKSWYRRPLQQIGIPRSLQRVVQQRLEHLGEPARQLVDLAAVIGRGFDFDVLQALTGQAESQLLGLIKELIVAHLVVEESAERFAFRHALTREALYARLLVRERQTLHGQIGHAIEHIYGHVLESYLEALAYHYYEAALWTKALEYARRAGEKAQALYAPRTATEQFTRAIDAARRQSVSPPLTLYLKRGQTFETLGDFEAARADYEMVLQTARTAGDHQAEWQALHNLGLLWASNDYRRTGDYCRQALELARSVEDPILLGHSLNRLGNWYMNSGQPFEALDYHREALALFEVLDDQPGIAATLDLLGMTCNQCGDVAEAMTYWEQAIPILRQLNDRQTLASSLANLVLFTLNLEQAQEAVKLAYDIGWRAGEAYALGTLSQVLFALGRYGEALTARMQSLDLAQAIEHPQWVASGHIFLGLLYTELLALTEAQEHLEQGLALARQVGSSWFSWVGTGGLALVYILQGELEEAETLLAEVPQAWMPSLFKVRLAQTELALAHQDATRMLQALNDLFNVATPPKKAIGLVSFLHGPALILQGQALTLLGRLDEAKQVLHQARKLYTTHGIAQGLWQIHLALGKLSLAAGRPEQTEEAFAAARVQIEELAATIGDDNLRENFLRRAMAMIPPAQPLTPRQATKQEFGGLTRRERQVAAVVAQGLSNQEIADELVVSIKTVEAHVSRILSKLGFSSRTQIAAWAVAKGLASAPPELDSQ